MRTLLVECRAPRYCGLKCAPRWPGQKLIALLFPVLLWPVLLWTSPALALDPEKPVGEYGHDVWQTEHGLPSNSIQAITQTGDGYLWLGTKGGLVRFDGVRFTVFDKINTREIKSNDILALCLDHEGSLWVGTYGGGLVRLKGGRFTLYTTKDGLSDNFIQSLYEDKQGALWVGTVNGLSRFKDERFTVYKAQDGLPNSNVGPICEDLEGNLWVGTAGGLARLKDGRVTTYTTDEGLLDNSVLSLLADRDGSLWIGSNGGLNRLKGGKFTADQGGLIKNTVRSLAKDREGNLWVGTTGGGMIRMKDEKLAAYTTKEGLSNDLVGAIYSDREGSLWVGTYGGGLNRLKNGKFIAYTTADGLSNDFAFSIYEDREGNLWVGTYGGGLNKFKDGKFTAYRKRDGLLSDVVRSVCEDREGGLWVGTYHGGLNRLKDGKITSYTTQDGLSNNSVYSIYEDRRGGLWVGTDRGLNLWKDGRFTVYTTKDGLPNDVIRATYEDQEGNLWIGTYGGGLVRMKDGRFTAYTTKDGLSDDFVRSIYEDREQNIWIATYGGGVVRLKHGRFTAYTTKEGLFDNTVYQVLDDDRGHLWMSCNRGIFFVSKQEMNDFAEGKTRVVTSVAFGTADGMKSSECNGGNQPAGWKTRDGRLWFPTIGGVVCIDPDHIKTNLQPPPVLIEQVVVDSQTLSAAGGAVLSPGREKFEFNYTALSFLAPEKVNFKFKLEGFDKAWVKAGTRRVAYYTHLPPGSYVFRVIACNNDGVWNETGASFGFTLRPHFYQTYYCYALCVLALALIVAGGYLLRVRQLKAREKELVWLVKERTRQLEEANEVLKQMSFLDSLTGIANRRRFDEFFDLEWRRAVREGAPLSLLLVDIDFFKPYNDTHGHQSGDECLKHVAGVFAHALKRPGDLVARYGGEEFIAALYGTDAAQACELAESLRTRVAELRLPHTASPISPYVTTSIGVATIIPTLSSSRETLLAAADSALYQAKREGRNQVRSILLETSPLPQLTPS